MFLLCSGSLLATIAARRMGRLQPGIIVLRQRRNLLTLIPSASQIGRPDVYLPENSHSLRRRARFRSQILTDSISWVSPAMLAGHQVLDRLALVSIMRRLAAGRIMRLFRLMAHTQTPFTIVHKIWSPHFACAAMTEAQPMVRQYPPTQRNAVDCTGT